MTALQLGRQTPFKNIMIFSTFFVQHVTLFPSCEQVVCPYRFVDQFCVFRQQKIQNSPAADHETLLNERCSIKQRDNPLHSQFIGCFLFNRLQNYVTQEKNLLVKSVNKKTKRRWKGEVGSVDNSHDSHR